jgi:hypothetical protein
MAENMMGDSTLPASWFTNEKFFELENRAIFSKVSNFKFYHYFPQDHRLTQIVMDFGNASGPVQQARRLFPA